MGLSVGHNQKLYRKIVEINMESDLGKLVQVGLVFSRLTALHHLIESSRKKLKFIWFFQSMVKGERLQKVFDDVKNDLDG